MDSYGFYTQSGFKGRLSDGEWMLFASYSDYIDYMNNNVEEEVNDVA